MPPSESAGSRPPPDPVVRLGEEALRVARGLARTIEPLLSYVRWLRSQAVDDPEGRALLAHIEAELHLALIRTANLPAFAAPRPTMRESIPLRELVAAALDTVAACLPEKNVRFESDVPLAHRVVGDRVLLRQAVANLLLNAYAAVSDGGTVSAASYLGPRGIELEIADDGPGLPADVLAADATEPHTAHRDRLGLGLAAAKRILADHDAALELLNCPEGGTACVLRFPPPGRARAAG